MNMTLYSLFFCQSIVVHGFDMLRNVVVREELGVELWLICVDRTAA